MDMPSWYYEMLLSNEELASANMLQEKMNLNIKKGTLTKTAKKSGGVKKGGGLKVSWLLAHKNSKGKVGKRARLALAMRKWHHGKKK